MKQLVNSTANCRYLLSSQINYTCANPADYFADLSHDCFDVLISFMGWMKQIVDAIRQPGGFLQPPLNQLPIVSKSRSAYFYA